MRRFCSEGSEGSPRKARQQQTGQQYGAFHGRCLPVTAVRRRTSAAFVPRAHWSGPDRHRL